VCRSPMVIPFGNTCDWHAYYSLPVDIPVSSTCVDPLECRRHAVGAVEIALVTILVSKKAC
jgi:hypothetical protein